MFQWIEAIIVLMFFLILFSSFYSFFKIIFQQEEWIRNYFKMKKKSESLCQALPTLLLQLSSFLRSGYAFPSAMKYLCKNPLGSLLYTEIHSSSSFSVVTSKNFSLFFDFLKVTILASKKTGIALSDILKHMAELCRNQLTMEEKTKLLTFPLKAEATIAIILPWLVLMIFGLMDFNLITNALTHVSGVVGFSTAILLEGLGILWMQKILR